jgi:hypothetical protein
MIALLERPTITSEKQQPLVIRPQQLLTLSPGAEVIIYPTGTLVNQTQRSGNSWTFYEIVGDHNQRVKFIQRISENEIHSLSGNYDQFAPLREGFTYTAQVSHLSYMRSENTHAHRGTSLRFPVFDAFLRRFGK